jgi:hypothetical protein
LRRRPGWLDRVRGAAGAGFARPLAGAMTAIGLAGLLVTIVPLAGPTATTDRDLAAVGQSVPPGDGAGSPPAGVEGAAGAPEAPEAPGASAASSSEPSAAAPAASGEPMPVAASQEDQENFLQSSVPDDAVGSGAGGQTTGRGSDTQASPPTVAQVPAPSPTPSEALALRTTSSPTSTPTPASDPLRPAVAVGSAVLLAGGLVLLVLTRRRQPDRR